jgi:hypothetical protein
LKNQVAIIQQQLDVIGPTTVNTTVNFNPAMTRNEMQELIDAVKPTLVYGVKVRFEFANGIYNLDGSLDFKNFKGYGEVEITAPSFSNVPTESLNVTLDSHAAVSPFFKFFDCTSRISVNGIAGYYATTGMPVNFNYGGVIIVNSTNVNFNQCYSLSDNSSGVGIYYDNSSGTIQYTYTNSGYTGIKATNMSRISINDCHSNSTLMPLYGIAALEGSEINLWDNNAPSGSVNNAITEDGGRIYS